MRSQLKVATDPNHKAFLHSSFKSHVTWTAKSIAFDKVAFVTKHATEASAALACGNLRDFYKCKRKLSAGGRKSLERIVTEDGSLCVTFEEIKFAFFDHFGKLSNGKITSPVDVVRTFRACGRIDPLFEPDHSLDESITSIMHKCKKLSAPGRDGIKYCVYSEFANELSDSVSSQSQRALAGD